MAESKSGLPEIEELLSRADPMLGLVIKAVIDKVGVRRPPASKATPFQALVRVIILQQMASRSAEAIYKNLQRAVNGALTPKKVRALTHDQIRAAGLSKSKADYVRNLSSWFDSNRKVAKLLATMSNEAVIDTLTGISGIGIWTVNSFLIFNLSRLDVNPVADLGIRRAAQTTYGLKDLASPALIMEKSALWKPYRSIACMYLWTASRLNLKSSDISTGITSHS
jgi:DNA-3-methyladenine glycosylase II